MRGKFAFAVVLVAVAAFVMSESQSFGRGYRRAGRCSSCGTSCTVSVAPVEASPSDATAANAPAAPEKGAVASPSDTTPQSAPSVTSRRSNNTYYFSKRARRRWARR
jgi:hypothetical protein